MSTPPRLLALVADISKQLLGAMIDLDHSLHSTCDLLSDRVHDVTIICLETQDRESLRVVACSHRDADLAERVRKRWLGKAIIADSSRGPMGTAYRQNRLQFHEGPEGIDPLTGARAIGNEAIAATSLAVAPLAIRGRPIGTIAVAREQGSPVLTGDELDFLEEVADRVAQAIDQARLYDTAIRRREQLETVTDAIPALISYVDREERYRFNNRAYSRRLGVPLSEITGKTIREVLGDNYYSAIHPHVARALEGASVSFNLESRLKGDSATAVFQGTYIPDMDEHGQTRGFVVLGEDRTEDHAREIEHNELRRHLERESARFRMLANSLPQLIWVTDARGKALWFNDRCYDYTGRSPGEPNSTLWHHVIHPEEKERFAATWQRALATGSPIEGEFLARGRDGSYRSFLVRAIPSRNTEGELDRWFGTATDVDELRCMRQELERSVEYRDAFLSVASHELKTPLTSLSLQLQLARRGLARGASQASVEQNISIAIDQSTRIEALIRDLLDVVRIQAGKLSTHFERVVLGRLVSRVASQLGEQLEAAGCELRIDDRLPTPIECDPCRIEQVLANLLTNVTKYASGAPAEITIEPSGENVLIRVRDHGPGIPEKQLDAVFERYERLGASKKIGGLGLGLYISREIVRTHHGAIRALHPTVGRGAVFEIELPIRQP